MTIASITVPRATTLTPLLILVNLVATFALILFGNDIYRSFLPSKVATETRRSAQELARHYPDWAAQHPGVCPRAEDLDALGSNDTRKDAWSHPYVVRCQGATATVISGGADETIDTDDDIRAVTPRI